MGKLIPDAFIKKSKLSIYLDLQSEMLYSLFLLYALVEVYLNIRKLRYWPLALTLCQTFFEKAKTVLELVSLPHFLHDFWVKIFLTLYYVNWPNFIAWLDLLLGILGNMCIVIICLPVCDVTYFEFIYTFLSEPFSYMTKKSAQKFKYLRSKKTFYHEIKSTFHQF